MESFWGSGPGNGTNHTNHSSSCPGAVRLHAEWVNTAFGECIDSPLKYVAFFIGLSSILCWLVAQAPQVVTNCRLGIADKALSFWFLMQWLLGDTTNLIGALLTHQLPSQIITAIYVCFIDTLMMTQFFYYVVKNQGLKGLPRVLLCPTGSQAATAILLPGLVCTVLLSTHWSRLMEVGGASSSLETSGRSGRVLLELRSSTDKPTDWHDSGEVIGYVIGCVSTAFYLGSRLPQIVQNFVRCSVAGVSLPMFILVDMGNIAYTLGIILYSVDGNFLIAKLPWLVGTLGTLCLDFTIFSQFIIYKWLDKQCFRGDDKELNYDSDSERKLLLLAPSSENSPPCFSSKGNIQDHTPTTGGTYKTTPPQQAGYKL